MVVDKKILVYEKKLYAGWADMDFNFHMKSTAYSDKSGDVRMMFFSEHGFPMDEFVRLKIGPVVQKEDFEYFREVRLLEELRVTLSMAGLSQDCSRWILRNEFYRNDEKCVTRINTHGGWLDLNLRRLVFPPEKLQVALNLIPKTEDFQELKGIIKK